TGKVQGIYPGKWLLLVRKGMPYFVNNIYKLKATEVAFFVITEKQKSIDVETPVSIDFTRSVAFAIRLVVIAVLILAVRWW
ncbi:hypothetical protein N9G60_004722, partial [Escherichia coli]|nr:hypothetical protein [Escherichia coli]